MGPDDKPEGPSCMTLSAPDGYNWNKGAGGFAEEKPGILLTLPNEEALTSEVDEGVETLQEVSSYCAEGVGGDRTKHLGNFDHLKLMRGDGDRSGLELLYSASFGAVGFSGVVGEVYTAIGEVHSDFLGCSRVEGGPAATGIQQELATFPVNGCIDEEGVFHHGQIQHAVAHLVENFGELGGLEIEDGVGLPEIEEELVGAAEAGGLYAEDLPFGVFDLVGFIVDTGDDFQLESLAAICRGEGPELSWIALLFHGGILVGPLVLIVGGRGDRHPGQEQEDGQNAGEGGLHDR